VVWQGYPVFDSCAGLAQCWAAYLAQSIVDLFVIVVISNEREGFMDRSIWATWYDLPEDGREEYLDWLHGVHLPEAKKRPGYLWAAHYESLEKQSIKENVPGRLVHTDVASLPAGDRYILLIGAETTKPFFDPTPAELAETYSTETKQMLSRRIGERSAIFVEEARVDGPEVAQRSADMTPGPWMQMGSFNSGKLEDEDELGAWYAQWRLPCMEILPGCIGCRKLVSASSWAKHSVLYEFVSLEMRNAHFPVHEKDDPEKEAWTDVVVRKLVHAPGSPNVGRRLYPSM
jgi:hypothetical protein